MACRDPMNQWLLGVPERSPNEKIPIVTLYFPENLA
jgi:hypothetical protein